MHSRRFASFFIGAWLAAGILLDLVVVQNFRSVDRFLNAPGALAAEQVRTIGGKSEARLFLRHEVGELNRFLFERWEYAQLALGSVLILTLISGAGRAPKAAILLAMSMLMIVLLQRFWLTPEVTRIGRLLETANPAAADTDLFWRLHGAYSGVELLKTVLGIGAAGVLLVRRSGHAVVVTERQESGHQGARVAG